MKRKILLFSAVAGLFSLTLSSYHGGEFVGLAGGGGNQDRTGNPNITGSYTAQNDCSSGTGCHAAPTTPFDLSFTLSDVSYGGSGRLTSGWFIPGHKYQVSLKGQYAAEPVPALPSFGFQVSEVGWATGSDRFHGGPTPIQAGSPAGLAYNPFNTGVPASSLSLSVNCDTFLTSGAYLIEQNHTITHKLGTITSSYDAEFYWTAPDSVTCATYGVDSVGFWYILLAADGDGTSANDVTFLGPSQGVVFYRSDAPTAVKGVFKNATFSSYPNPVHDQLQISMTNLTAGTYTVNVFDMSGKRIMNQNLQVNNSAYNATFNTANWPNGIYQVQFLKDGSQHSISIVKQ